MGQMALASLESLLVEAGVLLVASGMEDGEILWPDVGLLCSSLCLAKDLALVNLTTENVNLQNHHWKPLDLLSWTEMALVCLWRLLRGIDWSLLHVNLFNMQLEIRFLLENLGAFGTGH